MQNISALFGGLMEGGKSAEVYITRAKSQEEGKWEKEASA